MAPGLAVIVRIPAAQEREMLFVLSDLQGVWGDLKVADCDLSVLFLIFSRDTDGPRGMWNLHLWSLMLEKHR